MATKQQLKSQLDSLREENQRLEELVELLRSENPERIQMAENSEKARAHDVVAGQLEVLREENATLRQHLENSRTSEEVQILSRQLTELIAVTEAAKETAKTAETKAERMSEAVERAETTAERMAGAVERAETKANHMAEVVETERARAKRAEVEVERLTGIVKTAEERATVAEIEAGRLAGELARPELQPLGVLAAQQTKWEQRMEAPYHMSRDCEPAPRCYQQRATESEHGGRLEAEPEPEPWPGYDGRMSPPPLIHHPMSGPPVRGAEHYPPTSAGVPVTVPSHQMSGLPVRGAEQHPIMSAGVPVTVPSHQMSGLPVRGAEQHPITSAGVPVTVPSYQMSGLSVRGAEQHPYASASIPVILPSQQRGTEQYPPTPAGVPSHLMSNLPVRAMEQYPHAVPQFLTPAVPPAFVTQPMSVPLPRGVQFEPKLDHNWELTQALATPAQQLPPMPTFSGDDVAREGGSFLDWLEQFEMIAELAQWSAGVKLKQMVLRLRGSARAFYRTCTEEQKGNYRALIQEMEKRFTPVRIQALESSIFRERRQKIGESVDAYAQDLQQLFQKAYPKALQGSDDARVMGRAVLSNQFIGGLLSELKRKVAYIEGATFSELWQKARFEEARQLDLARVSWKQQPRRDDPKGAPPPQRQDQRQQPGLAGQFGGGQRRNPQSVKCYNCDRMGHFAKDCHATRRMAEAQARTPNRYDPIPSSRSTGTRAAAVLSVQGECQSHGEDDSLKWVYGMYGVRHADDSTSDCVPPHLGPTLNLSLMVDGIPIKALVDTGCPATIISREICRKILDKEREAEPPELWMERATKRLQHPSLSLKAYCGTELSIGAEIAVQVTTPYHTVHGSVLVQKDTPVDMLLGTDLMPALGIKVLDADGRSLLSEEQPVQVAAEQATRVSNEPVPLEEQSVTTEQPIKVAVGSHPPSEQLTQVSNQPITAIKEQSVEVTVESISPSQQPAQTILKSIPITPVINESILGEEQPIPIEQPTQATPAAATRQQPAQATVADESAAVKRQQPTQATVVQNVLTAGSRDWKRSLHPCRKVGNRRYTTPEYSVGGQIPVRLVQACKLPGRCGKLLKARMQRTPSMSPFEWLFEPKARLHNQALEIADAVVKPKGKCLLLPVTNSSGSPTLLRRGQVLGWLQPAEVIDSTGDVDRMVEDSDDVTVDSEVCVTPEIPGVQTSSSEIHSESDGEIYSESDGEIHSESDGETHSESDGANSDDETVEVYTTPDTPGVRMDNEAEGDTHSESETPEPKLEMDEERVAPNSARQSHLKAMLHLDQAEVSLCEREALENFLLQNADIFALGNTELGRTDVVTHSIDTGDHRPIHQHPRRIPFALRSQVDEMVQDMLDQGVIQPTSSPWASPIVLVKKKDGSMRFCVDYRQLNAITKLDVYPLPRIDDTLDVLAGARLFTTLDLASGYWQVSLDPAAREKTAFVTHAGLYEFEVMPFGLCNAPATFQRLMEVVLAGLTRNQCFVYLDDILIISRTWEEHLGNLQLVFDRLRSAGLRLRPKKMHLCSTEGLISRTHSIGARN